MRASHVCCSDVSSTLIQTHQEPVVFVVSLIHRQNIFHGVDKIGILPGRDAPAFSQPRFQAVFTCAGSFPLRSHPRRPVRQAFTQNHRGPCGAPLRRLRTSQHHQPGLDPAIKKALPVARLDLAFQSRLRPVQYTLPTDPPGRPRTGRPTSRRTWAHLRRSADPLQLSTIPREASGTRRLPAQRDRFSRLIQPLPAFRSPPRPGQA